MQGGEFAFVAFGLAQRLGILTPTQAKILLTTTAISMAATPALSIVAEKAGQRLERKHGFSHYVGKVRWFCVALCGMVDCSELW